MIMLVVEDAELSRTLLARQLERRGYNVRTASTANEAVAEIQRQPPQVIILDRVLPDDADGRKVPAALKQLGLDDQVAVIMATGLPGDEPLSWPGVKAVLAKPYSVEDVERVVKDVLGDKS